MRSFSRRAAAVVAVAGLIVAGAAVPPVVAGPGPVVIDDHDSHIAPHAYDVSSSSGGTVYATDDGGFGRLFLSPGTLSTSSATIDLGPRPRTQRPTTISGNRVAMPQPGATYGTPVTVVRHCLVGTCPTASTLTIPASWVYVGNADDRAVIYQASTNKIALLPWTSGSAITNEYVMPEEFTEAPSVVADLTGVLISGSTNVIYVNRATGLVSNLGYGNDGAVLTPSHVVWYAMGMGDEPPFETHIYRVPRNTTESAPAPVLVRAFADDAISIESIAATDSGVAWLSPNATGDSDTLWTMPYGGDPVAYVRPITSSGLSNYHSNGQILVNDRAAGVPGLYRVTPGSVSGTLTGIVPVRGANTLGLAVSHGRAAYIDDMTSGLPMFMRSVAHGGVPGAVGPESLFTGSTYGSVGLSGPYVAFTRPAASASQIDVVYGRTDGALTTRTFPISEVGKVAVSGRRALLTGGARSRVIDIPTGAVTDLGTTFAAIFGEFVATIDYRTGLVQRRSLDSGLVQTVRAAVPGCTTTCVDDDGWQMALWGHEVVYAFTHGGTTPGSVSGLWNGTTGSTAVTPMLTFAGEPSYTEIAYWSGLLLVAHHGAVVKLYDMRSGGTETTVDAFAEEPFALDGNVVAWRPLTNLKAVVRDVRDFVPGHTPELRYLGGVAPVGFQPDLGEWNASFLTSQDFTGSLLIHAGSATGEVVKRIPVGTLNGEIVTSWDGTDESGEEALPQGTYFWTLETGTISPVSVKTASGTHPASGSVYLSTEPLPAPVLTSPAISTDVSATASTPLSWTVPADAPAGTRYVVQRSTNGGAYSTIATTGATSMTHAGAAGNTYRFRVAAVDPAGRQGAFSAVRQTIVPFNDNAPGTAYSGTWTSVASRTLFGGQHRYSGTAGSVFSFKSTGTAIYLIGNRGTSYGQFQVSIDGGAYGPLVDAYSATSQVRKVVWSRTGLSNTAHTIKVRVYGTSRRPNVSVDAIGFLR